MQKYFSENLLTNNLFYFSPASQRFLKMRLPLPKDLVVLQMRLRFVRKVKKRNNAK
jgi:hypothetical protein